MPGGLLRHVDTGALCHRLYPPSGVRWPVFLHVPTTSRASWPTRCQPAPPVCTSCVCAGLLIISDAGAPPTQARRACRTWPACGCRPASAPPRKALSAIRRPRRAAPERITGHYAAHICQSALRSGAFSAGRLFQSGNSRPGPRNGLITVRRKMAGCPCCGQRARGRPGQRPRVTLSLAATGQNGSWLAAGAARARTGRVRNGGRPANSQVRRHNGKAGPWPRPWPGLDRPLAARSWPRFLRGARGTALAVSRQPDR